jgi:hypothetical protein
MAHEVTFTVPHRTLGHKDIEFNVRKGGAMFGTLKISQGGVVWRPRNNTYGYFLSWNKLDTVVESRKNHTSKKAL